MLFYGKIYDTQTRSKEMTFLKRTTAAVLAALTLVSCSAAAFAEQGEPTGADIISVSGETQVISTDTDKSTAEAGADGTGASVIETGEKTVTSIVDPEDENPRAEDRSGLDLANIQYEEPDTSDWTLWDGKTRMAAGTNYYIESKTSPRSNFTVPKGSRFLIKPGAELVIYKGKTVNIRGTITVARDATMMVSGTASIYENAGIENFGTLKGSLSAELRVSGDLINRSSGRMVLSGVNNIYKKGDLLNYGEITLTTNSKTKVTGDFQTPDTGRLLCRGSISVTINGRSTQAGYFSLTGQVVNSGVFVFERSVRYYKSRAARFAVSKSSRLIDYRYSDETSTYPDKDDDEASEDVTDIGIKGIDVSYAQGAINWQAVRDSGVKFAFLRASRGSTVNPSRGSEDTTFKYNVTEATRVGINVGVYHYLYAETVADARKEAKFFIKTIAPYKITYPVVLDVEEQSQANLGKKKITQIAKAFLDEVSAAGYYAMLYSNKSWLTQYLDMSQLSGYEVWLAQWNTVPTYKGDFGVWQYSCKGIVSGIDGYVDMNLSYKNYAKIIKKGGYNKLS